MFYRNGRNYPKIHMEPQKIWDSQSNQEQNEQCCRNCHYRFQEILQSPSNEKQYGTGTKTELQINGTN